jgi:hypothetical protein
VFFTAFGSTYLVNINVFTNGCGLTISPPSFALDQRLGTQRSQSYYTFEAVEGQTYTIRARNIAGGGTSGVNSGGLLYLQGFYQGNPEIDDLYLPNNFIYGYREGVPVNLSGIDGGLVPTGVAFDYTKRPMDSVNGGVNATDRLLVGLFGLDNYTDILNPFIFGSGVEEVDWIQDPFDANQATSAAQLYITAGGTLTQAFFGNGFLFVSGEGILPAYLNVVSSNAAFSAFNTISAADGDSQAGAPFSATSQAPSVEVTAPWALSIDEANGIAYYTSGSLYQAFGGQTVRRYNLATSTDMGVWATLPTRTTNVPSVRGLQYIGGGQVLVCNGDVVQLLNSSGSVVRTFTPSGDPLDHQMLIDVKLTSDGAAFWVLDIYSTRLYKFDLATGAELLNMPTWLVPGSFVQIAIYQPEGIPPGCPGIITAGNTALM